MITDIPPGTQGFFSSVEWVRIECDGKDCDKTLVTTKRDAEKTLWWYVQNKGHKYQYCSTKCLRTHTEQTGRYLIETS